MLDAVEPLKEQEIFASFYLESLVLTSVLLAREAWRTGRMQRLLPRRRVLYTARRPPESGQVTPIPSLDVS